ncbi:serine protease [Microbulbifer sp. JMSA004]|uniref:S1 family peptidase n=1 Tax=Microbulbifer sp. JMSA004 TaxID=3243370 RepID=UPI004039DE41
MHPLDKLMKSVVRIEATLNDGSIATGSGFAYRFAEKKGGLHVPAIVTNKHVIDGAVSVSLPISVANSSGETTGNFEVITYPINNNVIYHPDVEVDLCAILAAPIYQYFQQKKLKPALVHLNKEVSATDATFAELLPLEEVTMIGYPNGIWDSANNGSIARRGIIATIPEDDYLGKKQFVVDMACFPGSSGSPVYLANFGNYTDRNGNLVVGSRIKLLGILFAGPQHTASGEIVLTPVPTQNKPMSFTSMPNNLGYVIKATELDTIESIAENFLTSQTNETPEIGAPS